MLRQVSELLLETNLNATRFESTSECACYSDWQLVNYWAKMTQDIRVAEFGADSQRAIDVEILANDWRKQEMAGAFPHHKFDVRL